MGWTSTPRGKHDGSRLDRAPMVVVDLQEPPPALVEWPEEASAAAVAEWPAVIVGMVGPDTPTSHPAIAGCDTLIGPHASLPSAGNLIPADETALAQAISRSPDASVALAQLLRFSPQLPIAQALHVESLTYSMLQAAPVFAGWLAAREAESPMTTARPSDEPVAVSRTGGELRLSLNRPQVHNAFGAEVRSSLAAGLRLAVADSSITTVHVSGTGPSFCSGGDLREFGQIDDPASAHVARMIHHPGLWFHRAAVSRHVSVHLHGYAVGAGIEMAAFASQVTAAPGTRMWLPEIAMGLIPGAGGTVSLPRRIGRHRTLFLALSEQQVAVETARDWGLVDRIVDD